MVSNRATTVCDVQLRLALPTEAEAQCYLLSRRDAMTQEQIAHQIGVHQSSVARSIARCEEKIDAIKMSGRFDGAELELVLQKLTGRAAHGARLM